jgi:thiol-disulfide isomerase/thioredoxin
MKRMIRLFSIPFAATVGAMLLIVSVAHADALEGAAPNFTLTSRGGENLKLSEYRGDVVMINFWASWCGPCRQEMPLLNALYERYKPLGFTILGVNVEEDSSQAKTLLADVPVDFPILFDNTNKVSQLYHVEAMPSTILVDRNGNMRYLHQGYTPGTEKDYEQQVRALIRE